MTNMLCIFILPAIFILTLFLASVNHKTSSFSSIYTLVYCIIGLLLVMAVITRPSSMVDYSNYVEAYIKGSNRFEPSFSIIRNISLTFTDSHLLMMFIYGSISISITMVAIYKNSYTLWYSVLIWLSYIFIIQDMIQIRQAIASAIFLYAIPYIESKQIKIYILLNIIAILFHYSALAFLPLYFLSPQKSYKLFYTLLIPVSYILYFGNTQLIYILQNIDIDFITNLWNTKVNTLEVTEDVNLYNKRQIIQVAFCTLLWINVDKITKTIPSALLYLKIYTIAICTFIILYDVPDIASRLNVLYIIVEVIIVPIAAITLKPQFIWKIIILLMAIVFFTTYYYRYVLSSIL